MGTPASIGDAGFFATLTPFLRTKGKSFPFFCKWKNDIVVKQGFIMMIR